MFDHSAVLCYKLTKEALDTTLTPLTQSQLSPYLLLVAFSCLSFSKGHQLIRRCGVTVVHYA